MSINERLAQFLNIARDWEKKATNIPGLSLLKLPDLRGNPQSIVIEINPKHLLPVTVIVKCIVKKIN